MLIILATILCLTTPTGSISPNGSLIYLGMFRILLGVGVGGDYPMSASITSDRANLRKRGTMLSYIFSAQGWGSLVGSLVTIIVLLAYKPAMEGRGETSKVDGGIPNSQFSLLIFVLMSTFHSLARGNWRIAYSCLWHVVPASHLAWVKALHRFSETQARGELWWNWTAQASEVHRR